ncbi:MAG: hypothetical protein EOP94_00650 [Zymomonas sp.]|nr:MAG: hypothetical protein EOP94_00650 [Zymomonas sp.]
MDTAGVRTSVSEPSDTDMQITAIFFDTDGTLTDSSGLPERAVAFCDHGYSAEWFRDASQPKELQPCTLVVSAA